MAVNPDDKSLALFCDFENIALGVRDARYKKFNIQHVLERLLVKGSIVVKKAYCDWERYKEFKGPMHEASFELIEIPHVRMSGKNSADIRMVVDALDLCYTKSHVDTFVIISGDSDFSPLVSKLRENAKTVIGVGVKNSTSDLLISNCDEFIYYDDLVRELERKAAPGKRGGRKRSGGRGRGRRAEGGGDSGVETTDVADEARADAATDTALEDEAADRPANADAGEGRSRGGRGRGRGRGRRSGAERGDGTADAADERTDDEDRLAAGDPVLADADTRADSDASARDARADVSKDEDEDDIGAVDFAPSPYDDDDAEDEPDDDDDDPDELRQEGVDLVVETAVALSTERGGKDKLWGSMIKQALKRRRPGFNESYYGYESFSKMLEEAAAQGLLSLEPDDRSGGYIIQDITG